MNNKSEWDKILNPSIFKRIKMKYDELVFKFNIWRDIKLGFTAPDGQPLKCFKCKSKEMEEYGQYYMDGGYTEEYSIRCRACGQKLGHWAYGYWEM